MHDPNALLQKARDIRGLFAYNVLLRRFFVNSLIYKRIHYSIIEVWPLVLPQPIRMMKGLPSIQLETTRILHSITINQLFSAELSLNEGEYDNNQ